MRRVVAGSASLLGALLLIGAGVRPAMAAGMWSMSATPAVVSVGEDALLTFKATNTAASGLLGCVVVPGNDSFNAYSAQVVGTSSGAPWLISLIGETITVSAVDSPSSNGPGEWVEFTVAGTPDTPGTLVWNATAYTSHQCTGQGMPLAVPPTTTVEGDGPTPSPTPTPTPSATPTPKPSKTPKPTPTPTPLSSLPSMPTVPSPPQRATASPSAEPQTAPASPSPTPTPAGSPRGITEVLPEAAPPSGGGAPSDNASGPTGLILAGGSAEASGGGAATVSLGPLGVLDGMDVWAVPGAVVGGPGLLVIGWVVFQTGVAAAWLPAVRRLRGKDGRAPGAAPLAPYGSSSG